MVDRQSSIQQSLFQKFPGKCSLGLMKTGGGSGVLIRTLMVGRRVFSHTVFVSRVRQLLLPGISQRRLMQVTLLGVDTGKIRGFPAKGFPGLREINPEFQQGHSDLQVSARGHLPASLSEKRRQTGRRRRVSSPVAAASR